jgi:ABC-type transporter Mla subunit MlaD
VRRGGRARGEVLRVNLRRVRDEPARDREHQPGIVRRHRPHGRPRGRVLRGGGIPNLDVIQNEVYNILNGRADQIRDFLSQLDAFTKRLSEQRDDITRGIDSTDRLLAYVGPRSEVLDRVLTEIPPLITHFADVRDLFINAVESTGRLAAEADQTLSAARGNLHSDLQLLQRPLRQLGRAAPFVVGALTVALTAPFQIDNVPKLVRGDYISLGGYLDLTLSALDNAILTGTGFSGSLRALEQSWGRDPATMLPDVRFTPNPNNVPGGPLVERGE